jgi:hypothetical protein
MTSCTAYTIEEFNQLQQHTRQLSILNLNIRSLRKNFSQLNMFLDNIEFSFDLICLTEIFIYDNETKFFTLNNYVFLGMTRESRGGGVGVFVHRSLEVGRGRLGVAGSEALLLSVGGAGWASSYKLTLLYRQPSAEVGEFLESLEEHLFASGNEPHIILGDINIDTSSSDTHTQNYLNLINSFNYTNVITVPTRISPQKSSTLDHILINFDSHYSSGTIYTDISDHLPSFILLKSSSPSDKATPTSKLTFIDKSKCIELVEEIDWEFLYDISNIEELTSVFSDKIKEILHACSKTAYKSKINQKSQQTKKWITPLLKHKIKAKNRLFRKVCQSPLNDKLRSKYVALRNEITRELKSAKLIYFGEKFKNFKSSYDMWKFIKAETGFSFNHKKDENSSLKLLDPVNNTFVEGTAAVADIFNSHFSTVGEKLASKFSHLSDPILHSSDQEHGAVSMVNTHFKFNTITPEQVSAILNKLNVNKATGLDLIPAWILKQCSCTLAKPLTHIFNKSIESCMVPSLFKQAKVKPLFKKGNPCLASNYRPISILPVLSKVLEKLINNQIMAYLEENQLLNPLQFGFRKNKSTKDAILEFTNDTLMALNRGMCVLGIFIDFSKAFDTIDHQILICKMKNLGFSDCSLRWFSSYFTNRSQIVTFSNHLSKPCKLTVGVPQGSILGPTLFLIYINDLCSSFNHLKPILYADDTNLFYQSKNLLLDIPKINQDLNALDDWCKYNKLTINLEKTNFIIIKNRQNPFSFPNSLLKISNTTIEETSCIKFLGITIDNNLSFKNHISNLISKLRPYVGLFYRCSKLLPKAILLLLYNSYINSQLCYCIEAYGTASDSSLKTIYILQKRIIRIISNSHTYAHTQSLFFNLNIPNIYQLFQSRLLLISHSKFYSLPPNNSSSHFDHSYPTRSSKFNLPLPVSTSLAGHRSPNYQISALWNSLPLKLRQLKSLSEFKRELRRHLLH